MVGLEADVAAIGPSTIERFGALEWEKAVLTNSVHGHLGIYSLIGVKMGLFALDYFKADAHALRIRSYAGSIPPISCLNDGLQISTGATLGRGLIDIDPEVRSIPQAEFTHDGKTILVRLKEEYARLIWQDIQKARESFGDSPAYWEEIRRTALRYWSTWDRHEIFEI